MADCEMTKIDKLAQSKMLTALARVTVVLGTPLLISLVGWAANNFDHMRMDLVFIKEEIAVLNKADNEFARRLRVIEARLFNIPLVPEDKHARPN